MGNTTLGRCEGSKLGRCLGGPHPISECLDLNPDSTFSSSILLMSTLSSSGIDSGIYNPAIHLGEYGLHSKLQVSALLWLLKEFGGTNILDLAKGD